MAKKESLRVTWSFRVTDYVRAEFTSYDGEPLSPLKLVGDQSELHIGKADWAALVTWVAEMQRRDQGQGAPLEGRDS